MKIKLTLWIAAIALSTALGLATCTSQPQSSSTDDTSQSAPTDTLQTADTTTQAFDVIAFGSCNRQDEPQIIWQYVIDSKPDLWLWTGDNIYADTEDMTEMRTLYDRQLAHTEYQALLDQCPVIGTWDDHDYGINNGGKEFPKKKQSKAEMLRFLAVPKDREVWQREGVYDAYTYGSEGHQVKVILLDTRYFRDEPGKHAAMLGQDQWTWLEQQLTTEPAEVNLIVSSIQFLAEDHRYEKWSNFPTERQRMIDLLVEHQVSHPIFISGDRHIAEISKMTVENLPQPIYDITASGLTHSWESASEPNRYRISPLVGQKNFGIIHFDWPAQQATIQIKGLENEVYASETITL